MINKRTKKAITIQAVILLAWVVVFTLLPHIFWSIGNLWEKAPYFYLYTAVVGYIVLFVNNAFLRAKKYLYFALFSGLAYVALNFIESAIISNLANGGFLNDYISSQALKSSKAFWVFSTLYVSIMLCSVVIHIIMLSQERKAIEKERLKAELSLLKTQINPHFFFNSLNSIYRLSLTKDDRAPEAIITLSDMMRYVLTDAKSDFVDISKEEEYLSKYIELQQNRLPQTTAVQYNTDIDGSYTIAPLMLITFFENAFKYGVSATYDTIITISLDVKDGKLSLSIHNNIFKSSENRYGTASGINNVVRRLELLYKDKYTLDIDETEKDYTVKLTIDLR